MYCPSIVGMKGQPPCWKVTSGSSTSGMKVPAICIAISAIATRIVLRKRKVAPIATSHQPITPTQRSADSKGIQSTVIFTRGSAGESPKGFKTPNQMKMTPASSAAP